MSDLKFNIDGKDISSEEIKSGKKDFNTFYSDYASKTKPFFKKGWFWAGAGLASLAIFATVLFNNNKNIVDGANQINVKPSNATNVSASAQKTETLPFVNPPMDGINVPWEKLLVDAAKGGVVTNKRGSEISFPQMAFVDSLGNSIKQGKVEIRYREFLDQIDQIVSGITMTYDSVGTTYQFLSAGMIEVKGYLDNKEVAIAPEKKIDIQLVSNTTGPEYNLYNLNVKKRNWKCIGKPRIEERKPKSKKEIEEQQKQDQKQKKAVDAKLQKTPEYTKLKKKGVSILSAINTIKDAKPKEPKEAIKDIPMVNFDFNKNDYPELSEYSKVLFQLDKGQKINPDDASRIWNEVNIEKQDDQYKITFTETPTGYKAAYVTNPVFEGKSYDQAKEIFDGKFSDYSKNLSDKKSIYKILKTKISIVRNKVREQYMIDYYKSAGLVGQLFNTEVPRRQTFSVNVFGIYNCDVPIPKKVFKTGVVPVNQIAYNAKSSFSESVFYVSKKKNTYLSKSLAERNPFYYRKKGDNLIILVKGKQFGFIDETQFKAIKNRKDGIFDFKTLKTATNLEDLKRQLKFKM
jgi:hypothetical protein